MRRVVRQFWTNREVGTQGNDNVVFVGSISRAAAPEEIGEEFVEEGVAGILLGEQDWYFAALFNSLDMRVAGSTGAVEHLSIRCDFKAVLKCKAVEPGSVSTR